MKAIRRLDAVQSTDRYARAQRGLLRRLYITEAAFRELERRWPERVVEQDGALLAAEARGHQVDLHYSFPNRDAFARLFPPLFERIAAVVQPDEGPLGFRFQLTDAPSRAYVEPVLQAHAFEFARGWVEMTIDALPEDAVADQVAPGFGLRPARADDAEAIAELDGAAYAASWMTPRVAQSMLTHAPALWMLEQTATGTAVGYLRLRQQDEATGYIADLAVHPEFQRRGLGEAMLGWALARLRAQGFSRAALRVTTDNGPAIALYRKLGFAPGEAGLDYRRPIDEDEVRQVLEKRLGAHIRVRTRY